jgi:LDH2 family malate/lactate/ureidoglycolate dehydrogenase
MSETGRRTRAADLESFLASAFIALNVPAEDAATVAGLMVEADLHGYDTHGSFRLRQYVDRLKDGGTNPRARVRIARESDATAIVDGDNGLGHLAMVFATELAMEKAAAHGIGWVGIRNGNHAGPASLYANHVPPWGGAELLLGTNPIAFAVPAGAEPPVVLDMATTVAAAGKIKTLAQRGEAMPEGWMVGRDGKPLTDPTRQKEGFLLPIGGPKGYGLALVIGLLAGVLNGANFTSDVVDFTADTASPTNTGQFIAAISVAAFMDVADFKREVDTHLRRLKDSATLPGHERVRHSPASQFDEGPVGDRRRAEYRRTGVRRTSTEERHGMAETALENEAAKAGEREDPRYVIAPPAQPSLPVRGSDRRFPIHRIYCVGRNYAAHAIEMGHDPDREPPFFFQKNPDTVVGDGDVHHEVELVVALSSGGKDIPVERALDCVYGYAVGLDLTRRDLQGEAKKLGRPWEVGKAFDNAARWCRPPSSAIPSAAQSGWRSAASAARTATWHR